LLIDCCCRDRVFGHLLALTEQQSTPVCPIQVPIGSRKMAKIFGLKKLIAFGILKHKSLSLEKARGLEDVCTFLKEKVDASSKRSRGADDALDAAQGRKRRKIQDPADSGS
jgi:hypothetical protein